MNPIVSLSKSEARVGVVMGSDSDFPTLESALDVLREKGIPFEVHIVSAHRTPGRLYDYATQAADRGLQVIIAAAGGAAHLPGMVASLTVLPVIGVPVKTRTLEGYDSLLSILQMPAGVPVATVAVGDGRSAGEIAVRIIGISAI
ncbi:MAG: 5-(carboxyamino)imidazole ribonucleotide mutase [Clostridia bacterium]|nr:5-(carboxyamino)imidazole ribonucleotide mutase [Clostridia bacterium]